MNYELRIKSLLVFIFSIILASLFMIHPVHADEIEDLQKQINELSKAREQSISATKPLEGQLTQLKQQLIRIQANLDNLSASIQKKQQDLDTREEKLVKQQVLLEERVRAYYIRSFLTTPLLVILSSVSPGDLFRELSYRQTVTREDKSIIASVTDEVIDLLTEKEKLEKDKLNLASLQDQVDKNAEFLGGEVKKAKNYQAELTSKIVSLSAKQQEILASKLASLNISRSAASIGVCADDRHIDPGFSNAFAFFTYGAPHRVGMNQFGAKGRAEAGQGPEDILKAYFQNFDFVTGKEGETVVVNGTNEYGQNFNNESMNIEEYLKHLYEMPTGWPSAALEAQVIAARSYALAVRNLRPSQADQVIKKELNSGSWIAAVEATKGKIMAQGGNPIKAWYASTHGGYVFTSVEVWGGNTSHTKHGADTISGNASGFADLQSGAYDKSSPWFYCDWGSRSQYGKTAWLKPSEVADIVNTLILVKADSAAAEHLYQTDKPSPGGDNWDEAKVRQELVNRGLSAYSSVSEVSISADFGSGRVNTVNISGDAGNMSFNGGDFKNRFNLRAPANIQIVGPLFNVEKK